MLGAALPPCHVVSFSTERSLRQNAIEEREGVVEFWSELLTTQNWAGMVKQSGNWETKEVVQDIPLSAIECYLSFWNTNILKEGIPFNNMWQIGGSERP